MASEYTANYHLDKYAGTDKPNLRDQYNNAMDKIDAQFLNVKNDSTLLAAKITAMESSVERVDKTTSALKSTVEAQSVQLTDAAKNADDALSLAHTNETDIAAAEADIVSIRATAEGAASSAATAQSAATQAKTTAEGAASSAATAQSTATLAQSTAEGAATNATAAQSAAEAAQNTANSAVASANAKAPISHASSASTYGVATSTDYGHVKLTDTLTSGGAASATATTPNGAVAAVKASRPSSLWSGSLSFSGAASGTIAVNVINNAVAHAIAISASGTLNYSNGGTSAKLSYTLPAEYRPTRDLTLAGYQYPWDGNLSFGWTVTVDNKGGITFNKAGSGSYSGSGLGLNVIFFYGVS